jgi:hypothetical protein
VRERIERRPELLRRRPGTALYAILDTSSTVTKWRGPGSRRRHPAGPAVHDHLRRVEGRIAAFRELLGSALHANLTQVSVRQNEDMRKISA